MNRLNEYNAKMCQSARGLQNFASFFANQFCGRNAVKRDIESCSGLTDYQKEFYCKQSDRQLLWQEVFTSVLLRGMNRLR